MAVPGSGQLRLRADIAQEVDGSATGTNVSLRTLSDSAGKAIPDAMSEFYGYSSLFRRCAATHVDLEEDPETLRDQRSTVRDGDQGHSRDHVDVQRYVLVLREQLEQHLQDSGTAFGIRYTFLT